MQRGVQTCRVREGNARNKRQLWRKWIREEIGGENEREKVEDRRDGEEELKEAYEGER